jgi:hypothetical protein
MTSLLSLVSILLVMNSGCALIFEAAQSDAGQGDDANSDANSDAALFDARYSQLPAHLREDDVRPGSGTVTIPLGSTLVIETSDTPAAILDSSTFPDLELKVAQQAGSTAEVVIARADTFTVAGTLIAAGTRPLVLLANRVEVTGTIDASSNADRRGAGGGVVQSASDATGQMGSASDFAQTPPFSGGGGGGFGEQGAEGGELSCSGGSIMGGQGGGAAGALTVLTGGGAGGLDGSPCMYEEDSGKGGGAVQISAYLGLEVKSGAIIDVGGAGGAGGPNGFVCAPYGAGGAGGGAGGLIHLEATSLSIADATLYANGGGGGGTGSDSTSGGRGEDGGLTRGGGGWGDNAGGAGGRLVGGDGNSTEASASAGNAGNCSTVPPSNGGGGGGSAGILHYEERTLIAP